MQKANPISLLTQRAEDVATCARKLEGMDIKPLSIVTTEAYALIFVADGDEVKKLDGKPTSSTWVSGQHYVVHQALINNVLVKWLTPISDAQQVLNKVH